MNKTSPAIVLAVSLCVLPFAATAALSYKQAIAEHKKYDDEVKRYDSSIAAEEAKLNRNCGAFACQNQDIKQRIAHMEGMRNGAKAHRIEAGAACYAARDYMCPAGATHSQCLQGLPCPAEGKPADIHSKDKNRPGAVPQLANLVAPANGILVVNTFPYASVWVTVYDASKSKHLDVACVRPRMNRIANTEGIQGRIKDDKNAKFFVRVQKMETEDCKGKQYCDTTAEIHGSTITYAQGNGAPSDCFMDSKYK